jgi:hypothetical protein
MTPAPRPIDAERMAPEANSRGLDVPKDTFDITIDI